MTDVSIFRGILAFKFFLMLLLDRINVYMKDEVILIVKQKLIIVIKLFLIKNVLLNKYIVINQKGIRNIGIKVAFNSLIKLLMSFNSIILKSLVSLVVFTEGLQGSFFVIHNCYRQLAKHHKYSIALFGFAYPKQTTENKILAQRGRNFAEVFC